VLTPPFDVLHAYLIYRCVVYKADEAAGRPSTGVRAKYLETVVGQVGGLVVILRGPHRLQRAKLLESDSRAEKGVVQLREDLSVHTLHLDDIAEYRGPRGEDEMEED
jgi:hypothetical protein